MKVEQVPCGECGISIPAITAERTRGLCIPCKMRLTKADPFQTFYKSLVDRVHNAWGGFDTLTENEKIYYATSLLRNEIKSGGFHQYFFNSSGSYYEYAEKGLIAVGPKRVLDLLQQAKEIVFPGISVPVRTEQRRNLMPAVPPDSSEPEWIQKLKELDQRFSPDSESLASRLKIFASQHSLVSEHDVA